MPPNTFVEQLAELGRLVMNKKLGSQPVQELSLGDEAGPRNVIGAIQQGVPLGPPPAPGAGPQGEDPVLAALRGVLASIPAAPDRGAFFAPFDQAEGRARSAYDEALPAIAAAYVALRDKLGQGQAQAVQSAEQRQSGARQLAQQGADQVNALQAQALADLQRVGGGDPALGSLTGAAQAQAGANQASLALQQQQADQFAQQLVASMEAQGADRRQAADSAETAANVGAQRSLNQILNHIGTQRVGAEREYLDLVNGLNRQRAAAELDIARAQRGPSEEDQLDLALKRQRLAQGERGLGPDPASAAAYNKMLGERAERNPVAFSVFQGIIDQAKSLPHALALLAEMNPDKDGNVKVKGKRISTKVIRDWLIEHDANAPDD